MPEGLPKVVVAGQICLDLIPDLGSVPPGEFFNIFRAGRLVTAWDAAYSTGGAVANTGLAISRFGIPVQLVARVGDDVFGEQLRSILRRYGPSLDAGIVTVPGASTSYTLVISPAGLDRAFIYFPGANETFAASDVDDRSLEEAALFHFGYPPLLPRFYRQGGRELVDLFRRARHAGAVTSLDLTLPDPTSEAGQIDWLSILAETLPYVDIFLPSLEETLFMLRRTVYEELSAAAEANHQALLDLATPQLLRSLSRQMLEMGAKIAGLKLGARGFYLCTASEKALGVLRRDVLADPAAWADQTLWAPAFWVEVVGTTGAGDAAIAGFLAALLRGLGPSEALTAAVAAGACCVEAYDALSGLCSWDEMMARVAACWPRRAFLLSTEEWDEVNGLWSKKVGGV